MRAILGLTLAAAAAAAAPTNNATAGRRATCPSAYGPGKHAIQMQIPDAADPSYIWTRGFEVFVPDEMPLSEQRPTMLMWHGCGSDPEKFEEESEMDLRVGRFQYYSIFPRGTSSTLLPDEQYQCITQGGTRCGWNSGWPNEGGCQTPSDPRPDDTQFAELILRWMEDNLCVDMSRVFIAGFSNGGSMTYKLNCLLSQNFAGMMTIGSAVGAATTPGAATCAPQKALPAINFCGGSDGCYGAGGLRVREQLAAFATANGCTGEPERHELSSTSYCYAATGCPAGLPVEGCGITGLAHCWPNWPGAGDAPCQNQDPANVDASIYLLDFFNNLPPATSPRL